MSAVKLVAVFVENKPGLLARLTKALSAESVNIRWVTIANMEKFGVIKFIVDKPDAACQVLRAQGFTVSQIEIVAVEVRDRPGELHTVADNLAQNGINVENASGFVTSTHRRAVVIIETQEVEKAKQVLKKQGLHLLTQEELLTV